jgi:mannose-1-phosphate guanylyltransferase
VLEFREKPEDPIPGDVNAGTYLIDPAVLRGWTPGETVSIERDIFPAVIDAGHPVYGYVADAYWLDLGTPEKYLQAHFDMFEGRVHDVAYPAPWIAEGAVVDLRAHLGRWVAVGRGATVGPDAQVDDSVLHEGARIGAGARVSGSVLAANATVGDGAIVTSSVLGEGSVVWPRARLTDAKVPSGTEATGS